MRRSTAAAGGSAEQRAHQPADREAEFQRPAGAVALPERHLAGFARRGRDEHAVVRDLFDSPGGCAEHEGFAGAALEDHFLVQLADARRAGTGADEEHAEEAAVGNGAAVDDRHSLRALAAVMVPATRSHVMRGRSSANSSEG